MTTKISIPLLNPNEPEALLAALHVSEGQQVAAGDLLCTLETTKSTAELPAESSGYVIGLQCQAGDLVKAGDLLCYLAENPDWRPAPGTTGAVTALDADAQSPASVSPGAIPAGLRITQPALALARQQGLDLDRLPRGPLVTEKQVQSLLAQSEPGAPALDASLQADFDPTAILIYGGGGHGKACLDLLRALGTYRVIGFIDDGRPTGDTIMGVPVLGGAAALAEYAAQGVRLAVNAVGGIGNVAVRIQVFQKLAAAGFVCPPVVHPSALVEPSAQLAAGVQVFPLAYVGSETQVGYGTIVNTGAIVSHDCRLGDYANISPGAILAGAVTVGSRVLIGMGATVNLGAHLGAGARIGNGATVKSDLPENGIVRAGGIWPA